jgi:hypothetical protein
MAEREQDADTKTMVPSFKPGDDFKGFEESPKSGSRRPEPTQQPLGRRRNQPRAEAGEGDPVVADFYPRAKTCAGELREEMKPASQEITKNPARMRTAEREGIVPQVRTFVRQAEREKGRGRGVDRDEGLER